MVMLMRSGVPAGSCPPDWEDVQGDILIGLPKLVQTFVFLEITDPRGFKSSLRRSIARRATSARIARGWAERPAGLAAGAHSLGLNVAFTASGCAKLTRDRVPPDPAFLSGACERALGIGDAEPAINWLPQVYGAPIDAIVLISGRSPRAVDAEWKLLHNLLGGSVRVCYRANAASRPGAACDAADHFGNPARSGGCDPARGGPVFRDERAAVDAAPLGWMKNGSYLVFRRIEQLVPEYEEFTRKSPTARDLDAAVWRASGLVRRGIAFGPEVSSLERSEGKTSAERGLLFVSYQTSIERFETLQRRCLSPNPFAINSAAVYAFVPSIAALAGELSQ
jgi:hypothetical protein